MRNRFWSCVRSTFESELKDMLDELNKLGTNICEDLITYNKERWCKAYFKTFSKCDSVDNNMAESFNSWISEPRHKTIVSMLEEIRIKIMNRFAKIRAFADTWDSEISPMAMNVFNKNVERSMECEIVWNADYGYEIFDDPYRHTVDLRKLTCSCRSWELKGIPCAHGIAAMHHKQMDASQVIAAWYKKDTYMKAYSSFIQPVPNMKMWSDSTNPKVDPPPVKRMPGRPKRKRRKEIGEVKKAEKLSKRGIAMTCSICKSTTHNKRGCPSKPKTTTTTECNSSQHSSTKKSKKRAEDEGEGGSTSRGGQTRKGRSGYKRPRFMGHGVFVSQTGYTCVNQGMTTSRKVYTGTSVKSSSHVIGDIGYEPSKALKWKGQQAMSQRQLQMECAMQQIKARSEAQAKTKSQAKKTT